MTYLRKPTSVYRDYLIQSKMQDVAESDGFRDLFCLGEYRQPLFGALRFRPGSRGRYGLDGAKL